MIHQVAELAPDGAGLTLHSGAGTIRVPWDGAIGLARDQRAGREHLCWWFVTSAEADIAAIRVFGGLDGPPPELAMSDRGLIMLRYPARGPWHWRALDSWFPDPPTPDQAVTLIPELESTLARIGAPLASTPGASVIRAWSGVWCPYRSYQNPFSTEQTDWMRRAYYGGRCQAVRGLHSGVRSADMVSAYPWSGGLALPDVTAPVVPWEQAADGVIECTIDLDGATDRVIAVEEAGRVSWPLDGEVRGVWPIRSVRAAVESGATLRAVHREIGWARTINGDGGLLAAIFALSRRCSDRVRPAILRMIRMLHGKWGQRRQRSALYSSAEIADALDRDQGGILADGCTLVEIRGYWGSADAWAWCTVEPPEYPAHVCPVWSAVISARVTIRLARVERSVKAAGGRFVYCDTDGAQWIGAPGVLADSRDQLGGWKVEDLAWMMIHAPKMYERSDGRRALGGVPASVHEVLIREGMAEIEPAVSLGSTITQAQTGVRVYTLTREGRKVDHRLDREPEPEMIGNSA